MSIATKSVNPRRRRQAEASRNGILQAALVEFASEGLAGARMDAIADAAGVNKALLYYYFNDKETLYGAILDRFFEKLVERVVAVCNQPGTAGERFLSYARTHFDAIAESPYHAPIFMSELMSATRGGSPHLDRIFQKYMGPIGTRVFGLVQEGVNNREFRRVDPNQFLPSAIGAIVHYFLTAPVRQKFIPGVDFSSPKFVAQRRSAVLDFIAAALFTDREAGIKLAAGIARQDETTLFANQESTATLPSVPQDAAKPPRRQAARNSRPEGASAPSPAENRLASRTAGKITNSRRQQAVRNSRPEGAAQLSPAQDRDSGRSAGSRAPERLSPVGTAYGSPQSNRPATRRPKDAGKKGKHS